MESVRPGTHVTPNIRLLAPLGEGGMGSIWVAEHLSLKLQVVVKFVARELARSDESAVARFTREAAAAARIKSPYVVQTFDHGVMKNGRPYLVMEKLDGETLAARLERSGTLSLSETRQVVTQVAKALGRAHQLGIVHRDIKPDNIFLVATDDDELFAKVLDFGVAKFTNDPNALRVTATGAMVGTPGYMSPEQALVGKDIDHRTDLWSLGVVAYHALAGDIPFAGETLGALCVSIARQPIAPPSELRPELPPGLDEWMARALCRDPAGRFQSAKELARAFPSKTMRSEATAAQPRVIIRAPTDESEAAQDDALVPTQARPAGIGRNRAVVILLAALGLGLGIIAVATVIRSREPAATTPAMTSAPAPRPSSTTRLASTATGATASTAATSSTASGSAASTTGAAPPKPAARPTGGARPASSAWPQHQTTTVTKPPNATQTPPAKAATSLPPSADTTATVPNPPTIKDRGF